MTTTRRLAAILAADIAGYSRLIGSDEAGTLGRLRTIRVEVIDPAITTHHGRLVKTTGDGLLVEFGSVVDALRAANEIQAGMAERNAPAPKDERIEFRMGLNVGDIVVEDGDIFGDGVNVAARLEGLASPGGICVSARVQEDAAGKVDLAFEDMGEQQLKNIARPVRVYRVRGHAVPTHAPLPALTQPLPLPDKPSIAVLPFANMSGDPEQEYFADGMVEEITTALSRIRWLFVIARNSSFTYKGQAIDVKLVGRELGVRYVLEGAVRKAGGRVRITAQLIDALSGTHLWADRFDGALDDIFELQDEVASHVVGAIEPKLRTSEIERAIRKPTDSLDAYDLYLRALAEFHKQSVDGIREAIVLLKRGLSIDPSYAPAAAMIGLCRTIQKARGWEAVTDAEIAEGLRWAAAALDIGKDDPDALWMAANTLGWLARKHNTAENAIERSLMLNPNSAHAWWTRGMLSTLQNRPEESIEAYHFGMRLSPLDPLACYFTGGIAFAHLYAGRYAQTVEWANRSLAENSRFTGVLRAKVVACAHLGRPEEAREALQGLLALQPDLTIASLKAYAGLSATPEIARLCEEGFRKAGLPEE